MVNRPKRDIAAQLLEDFLSGRTSNDDFEDGFPNDKEDPALAGIYERLWFFWESRQPQIFHRSGERSAASRDLFHRCIFFLRSNLEYQWPPWGSNRASFPLALLRLLGLNKMANRISEARLAAFAGKNDLRTWPFVTEKDLNSYKDSFR